MPDPRLCDRLAGSVQGLDATVGDVLSFARDTRVSTRSCEPLELINAALEANAPLVDRVGVRVEVDVRPGLSADVDPSRDPGADQRGAQRLRGPRDGARLGAGPLHRGGSGAGADTTDEAASNLRF